MNKRIYGINGMDRLSFEFPMDNWKINEDPLEIVNRDEYFT